MGSGSREQYCKTCCQDEKGADTEKFVEEIKALEKEYAPATISAGMASMMGGSSDAISLNITAEKQADLAPMAEKLTAELKNVKVLKMFNLTMKI